MNLKISTKDKILNAAEYLFATSGFAETSMRQITNKAGVNLASINYHFGSKKDLIQDVLDRYLAQLLPSVNKKLDVLVTSKSQVEVEEVLRCFKQPLLDLEKINAGGTVFFLSLLGRGYVDVQGHLRKFITDKYRNEIQQLRAVFRQTLPDISEQELFWRLHLTLGTSVFTLAASDALKEIAKADFQQELDTEQLLEQIIPFVSAGFRSR